MAAYSGDATNNPVASVCGSASQSVIVNKVMPVATLDAGAGTGGRIHAVATLSGGFAPATGTITFTVTGPNDQFCGGSAVYTATVPVNGAGSYESGWFTPTAAGTYTYRLRYGGDTNNYGIGPTGCTQAGDSVTVSTSPTPMPTPTPTPSSGQAGVSGPAAVPATTRIAFHSPAHCVRGPFRVWVVGGARVSRVTYYLHGRRIGTVTRADRRGRFVATVDPRGLRRRARERLAARVSGGQGTQVLKHTFSVCS
jgi:hypothetical protein